MKRIREATAATAQVESTRRLMAEDESELAILGRRMNEMNAAVAASKQALVALEEEQQAARPEIAEPLYERFCEALRELSVPVQTGVFGARMAVELVNDGPVTIVLD